MSDKTAPWYLSVARIAAIGVALAGLTTVVYCSHKRHNAPTPSTMPPASNAASGPDGAAMSAPAAATPPKRIRTFLPSSKAGVPIETLRRGMALRLNAKANKKPKPKPMRRRIFLPSSKSGVPIETFRPRQPSQQQKPK